MCSNLFLSLYGFPPVCQCLLWLGSSDLGTALTSWDHLWGRGERPLVSASSPSPACSWPSLPQELSADTSSTSILTPSASSAGLLSLFLVSDWCSCMGLFCLRCGTFSLLLCLGIFLCTSWAKLKAFSHLPCSPCMPLCLLLPPFYITHKLSVVSLPQSLPLSQGLGSLQADPPSKDGGKEGIEYFSLFWVFCHHVPMVSGALTCLASTFRELFFFLRGSKAVPRGVLAL